MTKSIVFALAFLSIPSFAQSAPAPAAAPAVVPYNWGAPVPGMNNNYHRAPLTNQQEGVPMGVLSDELTVTSRIYDGMVSHYWIYVPAQYDAKTPAALMVFQDGKGYLDRKGSHPALNMIDNLIAQHKIPVMICVFINPGDILGVPDSPTYQAAKSYGDRYHRTVQDSMRSIEYDTVSDRYARHLRDEILPVVMASYNIRKDAYSHAITGSSSGGIASFNAAWQMPEEFSRVISWIGSFSSLQWHDDPAVRDGGQDYPVKVLHEPHRNIRVWLQDGSNDQEQPTYGSWPLANIQLANALKLKGYDFGFTFGEGNHSTTQGMSEFPAETIWLWRDYNPALTEQTYTQDPEEASRPPFRVKIVNREQSPLDRTQ